MRLFILIVCLTITFMTELAANSIFPEISFAKNKASLQRGAIFFRDYCGGCHSLRYMRHNQLARDLGLTPFDGAIDKKLLFNNLLVTTKHSYDPIKSSLRAEDAREWFGVVPPDLSLIAREKGSSWIVEFLKGFYADSSRPFASNNWLVPDVAMPNVLEPLRGRVIAIRGDSRISTKISQLLLVGKGEITADDFDHSLQDLVTFLVYVADPAREIRYLIGIFVILFLFVFLFMACKLKNFYWQQLP